MEGKKSAAACAGTQTTAKRAKPFAPCQCSISDAELSRAERELRRLGLPGTLTGMAYLKYAVARAAEHPEVLLYITALYDEIAGRYRATPWQVERASRTAIQYIWRSNCAALDELAGCHLPRRPSNARFIDVVSTFIRVQRDRA